MPIDIDLGLHTDLLQQKPPYRFRHNRPELRGPAQAIGFSAHHGPAYTASLGRGMWSVGKRSARVDGPA
ncbi:hypothetical protein N7468_001743 [Penicillium chermesinum]|uniref:Uncharacterized protein n=1 Tax=Penicillium chermesinum TaxID=63820 RepID=A0A9W9TX09_9EURO|nr:uncharacterized protein N7468_001743 [Penicillium chermesinum]KAJ5246760.1 hypothetical protein N7468_001743 [Penicillium chermesinum]